MSGEPHLRPEWLTPAYPELRSGPPWVMSEMVLAERELPAAILSDPAAAEIAEAVRAALAAGGVVVTGCGTSEHAARAVAALIADALPGARAGAVAPAQAFDAALRPRERGLCIAVSHNGTSTATVAALEAARRAGSRTCLITATTESAATALADLVFATPLEDKSWCHTVGYLSPVLAGAAIAAALAGDRLDAGALGAHLAACDRELEGSGDRVGPLAALERLLVVGSGLDAVTASEQALKIEEGAWIPATSLHLETLLHGHLPAADARAGLIAFLLDPHGRGARAARTTQALRAAEAVGTTTLLVADRDYLSELGGGDDGGLRIVLPAATPAGALGALLGGALALQRITLALSARRGTNPDLLRRDDPRYRSAALHGAHKLRTFDAAS